jgi:hypothetical protein
VIEIHGVLFTFHALTIIDTVTNYCEIVRITNKRAAYIGRLFENTWLSRYPRPLECIFDQGTEFVGDGFQQILKRHGIHSNPTTVKNPQANAVCERLHQTVGNSIRALLHAHPPRTLEDMMLLVDTALSTAAYSARAAIHRTLQISPGALVFHRDMLLDIPLIADLHLLHQRRQALIDMSLMRANNRRIRHDYQPNDEVLIRATNPNKLEPRFTGPHRVIRTHVNGTVTIQRTPQVTERINIRRIKPYYQ